MIASIENTVATLFGALERREIRYAVLRNYEMFPALQSSPGTPHTDIDLVVDSRDLEQFRELLAEIAQDDGWDVLSECDHWTQSKFAITISRSSALAAQSLLNTFRWMCSTAFWFGVCPLWMNKACWRGACTMKTGV